VQTTCHECRHCGRKIVAHNLGELNLHRHESVCLNQQKKKESKEYRRAARRAARAARSAGLGSVVVPAPGQFGFPFDGVVEEVV
jgi:hypothetical protein